MKLMRSLLSISLLALVAAPVVANRVTEDDLRPHIEKLASDEFEGREPGTAGEQLTLDYITQSWKLAGLQPGAKDGSWLDPVPLVKRRPTSATATYFSGGDKLRFSSDEIVLLGKEGIYSVNRLPFVFVGHGVNASGAVTANVEGKLALMLLDDADFLTSEYQSPRSRREALVKAGASGVIMIAGDQADYGVLRRQFRSRPMTLISKEHHADLEGAASAKFAVALVTAAGRDWDKLRAAARAPDYKGEALGISADFDVETDVRRFDSQNIIGKIPGRKAGSGAVLFLGHWDHLGICRPEDEADRICNGAVDNASGIAVLTEVAKWLSKKRHDRDIYFLATTAEESGLYGAIDFADDPAMPLSDIVIALNLDTIAVAPKGAKVAIVGRGKTDLDGYVDAVAKKLRRKVEKSTEPNAFIRRQDGWALTQKGVPAIMVGGAFADPEMLQRFLDGDYHGPNDEYSDKIQLGGAAEDATLHIELGKFFADTRKYQPKKTGG
jgi:hypothetical protein